MKSDYSVFLSTLLGISLISISPVDAHAGDADTLAEWVNNKLPSAIKRVPGLGERQVRVTSHIDVTELRDGKTISSRLHVTEKFSGENALHESTETDIRPPGSKTHNQTVCFAKNNRYYFEIEAGKHAGTWLLTKIVPRSELATNSNEKGKPVDRLQPSPSSTLSALMRPKFAGVESSASELVKLPGFMLKSAVVKSDESVIDIAFTFTPPNPIHAQRSEVDCTVRYELSAYGLPVEITESSGPAANPGFRRVAISISRLDDQGINYVYESSVTSRQAAAIIYSRQTKASVSILYGSVPESEFLLTAYGIPEPPGYEAPPTPLYVWLLAIAAACFALTIRPSSR